MAALKLWAGASGFSFEEWKGHFYPQKIRPEDMLAWYAERLSTVEINSSFRQMPRAEVLARWAQATPGNFRFSIKAPQRITHAKRLAADEVAEPLAQLYKVLGELGAQRGPVLFQTPPYLKLDLAQLRDFLQLLPAGHHATFEFRHDSWFVDEVYALLRDAGAALCLSEREDHAPPPLVETASWGYVRLRLESYTPADLAAWTERLMATGWSEAYVYFMHKPSAPGAAQALLALVQARPAS